MPRVDLHCHSSVSDGLLSPAELVRRAAANGVEVLALTDHDALTGIPEALEAAREVGLTLIPGVEISVSWKDHTVHVVGLGVDPEHPALVAGLEGLRQGRAERARKMADALAAMGIRGALEGAYARAANPHLIGRTHFARFLADGGYAKDTRSVFKDFLAKGKPGYVPHTWATLGQAVGWISGAGGHAVLAHPGRYKVGKADLVKLVEEFRDAGGTALEVASSSHGAEDMARFAKLARRFGLLASAGSDFHGPGESWIDVGRVPELPSGTEPVWLLGLTRENG